MRVIPRLAAAAVLGSAVFAPDFGGSAGATELQILTATGSAEEAELAVWVNGVPAMRFAPGEVGGGPLNMWLAEGVNAIEFRTVPRGEAPAAEGSLLKAGEDAPLAEFVYRPDAPDASFEVSWSGVPRWAWLDAEPAPGAEAELGEAVRAFHAAVASGDRAGFDASLAAYIRDYAALLGGDATSVAIEGLWSAMTSGALQPLPKLTLAGYRDGAVWEATGPDGGDPISIEDSDGSILSFGRWWARIDGRWQIIR